MAFLFTDFYGREVYPEVFRGVQAWEQKPHQLWWGFLFNLVGVLPLIESTICYIYTMVILETRNIKFSGAVKTPTTVKIIPHFYRLLPLHILPELATHSMICQFHLLLLL